MEIISAKLKDLDFLVSLRNEEVNSKYSKRGKLSRKEIKEDYFYNEDKKSYIVKEEENIGYLIFTKLDEQGVYEISVALVPKQRGRGKGKKLIKEATAFCLNNFDNVHKVVAEVVPENISSVKAFEAAGYQLKEQTSNHFSYTYEEQQ